MDYETDKTCGAQKTDSIAPISSLISSVETVDEFYTMGFADINNTFRALVGQLYHTFKIHVGRRKTSRYTRCQRAIHYYQWGGRGMVMIRNFQCQKKTKPP